MLRTVFVALALLAVLVLAAVAIGVRIASNYVRDNAYTFGETESARHEFQGDEIEGVRAEIELGAGTLAIGPIHAGSPDGRAVVVEITDNVVESISTVDYVVTQDGGGRWGKLLVTQDADLKIPDPRQLESMTNRWEIQFAPHLPLEIVIEMGAGELTVQADELRLNTLSIELGTGSGIVDLRGLDNEEFNGTIDNGIGSMEVYVPNNVGLRLQAQSAIGSIDADSLIFLDDQDIYVNSAYIPGKAAITLRVDTAVGSVEIYEE